MIIDNLDDGLTRLRDARKIATRPVSPGLAMLLVIDEAPRRQEDRDMAYADGRVAPEEIDEAPRRQEDRDGHTRRGVTSTASH